MAETREQWIIAKQMTAAVACLNAPFCDGPNGEKAIADDSWIETVAGLIAKDCGGYMSLEDAIDVLSRALTIRENLDSQNKP
jgi:hypothetical protein